MSKNTRSLLFYAFLLILTLMFAQMLPSQGFSRKSIAYTDLLNLIDQGKVKSVTIVDKTMAIATLDDGSEVKAGVPEDPGFYSRLESHGVKAVFEYQQTPWWTSMISSVLPAVLMLGAFYFIMQQTQGGGNRVLQFGKARARLYTGDKRKVTFEDVAGCDEVKEELQEIVDFLKHPKRYLEMGARIPKGVLLYGAPGTGKTLVARAVAGEAGVSFFSISGSDFVEMFVGVGASRVRDLFDQAKKNAPCIVFIDEIDAVGRQRGAGYGGGHDEREQTLNQLLVEMDGFSVNEGIIVMAATNRPDVLDPALLRPGRFDRQIVIDKPDLKGRVAIFKVHVRGKPLEKDVNLETLAKRTPGFTGADIENTVNEAALLAARKRKKRIGMEELEEAIDRVVAGPERKSRVISEKEKRMIAYHEAAHALVAKSLPNSDPVHKVSIIPRGAALGYVLQLPIEDRYLVTRSEILDRVTVALAGRVAEEMVFKEVSSGASDDLEKATKMIRKMVMEFGMSSRLGPLTFGNKQDLVFLGRDIARDRNYSEEVAAAIDKDVKDTVMQCYQKAHAVLEANREKLDRIAQVLMEKESLEGDELEELLKQVEAGETGGMVGQAPTGQNTGNGEKGPGRKGEEAGVTCLPSPVPAS
ncbi:MAG TPA: ATP-dependent metallopeptidase FtsH/Yme1/Tma family protein [Firmicutes bacterium]|nr:ATP-dependent metallopeptidase FtsH/Yme1/Tma family protein [Bacillota bacterium]